MRKFLVTLLAAGLLFASVSASNAVTVWLGVIDSSQGNNWLTGVGPAPPTSTLINPLGGGFGGFLNFDVPPPSGVTYGQAAQLGNGSFGNTPAYFDVIVSLDGVTVQRQFTVRGTITGAIAAASSTAKWTVDGIDEVPIGGGGVLAANIDFASVNPVTGEEARQWDFAIAGVPVNLWVDTIQLIDRETAPSPNSIEGAVNSVPEPGPLALLMGSTVGASLFFRRRKK